MLWSFIVIIDLVFFKELGKFVGDCCGSGVLEILFLIGKARTMIFVGLVSQFDEFVPFFVDSAVFDGGFIDEAGAEAADD